MKEGDDCKCNSPTFQTPSRELRTITLLISEFYCIGFTDSLVKRSRFILCYFMEIIIFRFNYDIVNIVIYLFIKIIFRHKDMRLMCFTKWLLFYELCYIKAKYCNLFWIFWLKIIVILLIKEKGDKKVVVVPVFVTVRTSRRRSNRGIKKTKNSKPLCELRRGWPAVTSWNCVTAVTWPD